MANFCLSQLGWHYLKEQGDDATADDPPKHGIHADELAAADLWATALVKANVMDLWDTSGWGYPNAPPVIEDIALKFAAGRIRFQISFEVTQGEASSGARKLWSSARYDLKQIRQQPFIVSRAGEIVHRRKNMIMLCVSSRNRRNTFPADAIEAFREKYSQFSLDNYYDDTFSGLISSF